MEADEEDERMERRGKGNLMRLSDWRDMMDTKSTCPTMSSLLTSKHSWPDRRTGTVSDHEVLGGWAPKDGQAAIVMPSWAGPLSIGPLLGGRDTLSL